MNTIESDGVWEATVKLEATKTNSQPPNRARTARY